MISPIGKKGLNCIASHDVSEQINGRRLVEAEVLPCINLSQSSVAFHLEASKTSDWFLFEIEHWVDMG